MPLSGSYSLRFLLTVARIERSEIRGRPVGSATPSPGFRYAQPGLQARLLAEPFKKCRNMDQIDLVVAGQGVHYDVNAGAERAFALPRLSGHQRQHSLATGR